MPAYSLGGSSAWALTTNTDQIVSGVKTFQAGTLTGPGAQKKIVVPHTWAISGDVKVASGDTDYILPFFVPVPSGQSARIVGVRAKIKSGTSANFFLFVGTTNGMSEADILPSDFGAGMAVTTTATTTSLNSAVTNDQSLRLEVVSVAGAPKNLSFTVYLEYTV